MVTGESGNEAENKAETADGVPKLRSNVYCCAVLLMLMVPIRSTKLNFRAACAFPFASADLTVEGVWMG
jgi:hypothetical protein